MNSWVLKIPKPVTKTKKSELKITFLFHFIDQEHSPDIKLLEKNFL